MPVHGGSGFGDGLLIRDLGLGDDDPNLELGFGAADGNVDMLITHTLQNGLQGGVVIVVGQGHILFAEAGQGGRNLGRVGLRFGEYRDAIERVRVSRDRQG